MRHRLPKPKTLAAIGAAAALVLMLLWMQGTLGGGRVGPENAQPGKAAALPRDVKTVRVEERELAHTIEVPGSIRSRTEANVATRIQAAVLEVKVRPGDSVHKGDLLARLDDRDVRAKVDQAEAALKAAEAEAERASRDAARMESLLGDKAATPQQAEAARAASRAAHAGVEQVKQAREQARVFLGESELRAPIDGVVTARRVDPGDLTMPGQPLLVLYDPRSLQIEASIEERLASSIRPNVELSARVEGVAEPLAVRVDEIVPAADPRTRTVLVKGEIGPHKALQPGTFARLLVPTGSGKVLVVPPQAIQRVGQLETAHVVTSAGVEEVSVRSGGTFSDAGGQWVEILAGLRGGETVVLDGIGENGGHK